MDNNKKKNTHNFSDGDTLNRKQTQQLTQNYNKLHHLAKLIYRFNMHYKYYLFIVLILLTQSHVRNNFSFVVRTKYRWFIFITSI